nr:MAG TPA: hypothetical protein [Caudoviricetes sp.]
MQTNLCRNLLTNFFGINCTNIVFAIIKSVFLIKIFANLTIGAMTFFERDNIQTILVKWNLIYIPVQCLN